jgi:hypothetical protein
MGPMFCSGSVAAANSMTVVAGSPSLRHRPRCTPSLATKYSFASISSMGSEMIRSRPAEVLT